MKKPRSIGVTVITLFPDFINDYAKFGIIARAIKRRLFRFKSLDLRSFGLGERQTVDDRPYGGGVGMVLRADVLHKALVRAQRSAGKKTKSARVVLVTPAGKRFSQRDAVRLSRYENIIFISGRYEGVDERITKFADEQLSIGDYVLMGGELPALVITEAVLRHVPGVLGKDESAQGESFSEPNALEFPQYTKPESWTVKQGSKMRTLRVPSVLRTGHHGNIKAWRDREAYKKVKKFRPDLLVH